MKKLFDKQALRWGTLAVCVSSIIFATTSVIYLGNWYYFSKEYCGKVVAQYIETRNNNRVVSIIEFAEDHSTAEVKKESNFAKLYGSGDFFCEKSKNIDFNLSETDNWYFQITLMAISFGLVIVLGWGFVSLFDNTKNRG